MISDLRIDFINFIFFRSTDTSREEKIYVFRMRHCLMNT